MTIKGKIDARRNTPAPAGDDLSVQLANLQRELAEARTKLAEREKDAEGYRSKLEASEAKYTAEKLRNALRAAALKAEAVDVDDTVDLLLPKGARLDGDRVVFGAGADAKDADAFVLEFIASKPHLRKSAPVAQGSGAPAVDSKSAPVKQPDPPKPKAGASPKEVADYYENERLKLLERARS